MFILSFHWYLAIIYMPNLVLPPNGTAPALPTVDARASKRLSLGSPKIAKAVKASKNKPKQKAKAPDPNLTRDPETVYIDDDDENEASAKVPSFSSNEQERDDLEDGQGSGSDTKSVQDMTRSASQFSIGGM